MVIKFFVEKLVTPLDFRAAEFNFPCYETSHSNEISHSQETSVFVSSGLASGGVKIL